MNIEHPVFTSGIHQDWIYDKQGKIQYWAIDDYSSPEKEVRIFWEVEEAASHIDSNLNGIDSYGGFELLVVEEAMPSMEMMELPGMKMKLRRPMMRSGQG